MNSFHKAALSLAMTCLLAITALAHPGSGITVDRQGNVYFLDTGSGLWKIDTKGRITRLSRQRFHWLALLPRRATNVTPTSLEIRVDDGTICSPSYD